MERMTTGAHDVIGDGGLGEQRVVAGAVEARAAAHMHQEAADELGWHAGRPVNASVGPADY
jgi:hypothetical protein